MVFRHRIDRTVFGATLLIAALIGVMYWQAPDFEVSGPQLATTQPTAVPLPSS